MGKTGLLCTSIVAAVPAGYLSYELVSTFLTRAEGLETIMYVIAGITLTCSALITITPVGILLFSPSGKIKPSSSDGKDAASASADGAGSGALADDGDDVEGFDDEIEFDGDDDEFEIDDEEEDWQ